MTSDHGCSGVPGGAVRTGIHLLAMVLATLLASRAAAQDKPPSPIPPLPTTLLVGFAECRPGPAYVRLALDASGRAGRLDFGPSIRSGFPRGALRVRAEEGRDGRMQVIPMEWLGRRITQQRAEMRLDGRFDRDAGRYDGRVVDVDGCAGFSLERRTRVVPEPDPDGLLFRIGRQRRADPALEDCRRYGSWLATEELIDFDSRRFSSLIHDHEGMQRVLGKTPPRFAAGDHMRLNSLGQSCIRALRRSDAAQDRALLEKVRDWVPMPLGIAHDDPNSSSWLLAEQVPLVQARSRQAAEAQLAAIAQARPDLDSLDLADRALAALERRQGWLDTLGRKGRERHARALKAAREELELRVAAALAESFRSVARDYDGFAALEALRARHAAALKRKRAFAGMRILNDAFARRAAADAEALWPALLSESDAVYRRLADAGYDRYDEMGRVRRRASTLAAFYEAHRGDLSATYADYARRGRALAHRMAERSEEQLVGWVAALPASEAYRAIGAFLASAFGEKAVPDDLPDLRDAVAAKLAENNPEGYRRPDIVLSLMEEDWTEVGRAGVETLAYYRALTVALDHACPHLVPRPPDPRGLAILGFYHRMLVDAARRLLRGEIESAPEAARSVFLTLNGGGDQPVCRRDRFGNLRRCSSGMEPDAASDAITTSRDAEEDAAILLQGGCDGDAERFVESLARFSVDGLDDTPQPPIVSAQDFVAGLTP